jgi:hypothetical protein
MQYKGDNEKETCSFLWGWEFFFFGVVDSFLYFLLWIDNWFLHIPYKDMDMFVLDLFDMVQTGKEVVFKEYVYLL